MITRKIATNFNISATFNGKVYNSISVEGVVSDIADDLQLDGYEPVRELVNRDHTNTVTFFDRESFWAEDDSATVSHDLTFTVSEYNIMETCITLLDGETRIDRPFAEIKSEFFDLIIDLYEQYGIGDGLVLDSDGCVEYLKLDVDATRYDIERGLYRVDECYGLHIWIKHTNAITADQVEELQCAVYDSMLASEIVFEDEEMAA